MATIWGWATAAYDGLRDLGSFIAGIFALIAGVLAYRAGKFQARATKDAADEQVRAAKDASNKQVQALKAQLLQVASQQQQSDERRRHALLMALSMEAARTKMLLELRIGMLTRMRPSLSNEIIPKETAATYAIEMMVELRHNPDLDALLPEAVGIGVRGLIARVDQLNAVIGFKGPIADLHDRDLDERLRKAAAEADELQKLVSIETERPDAVASIAEA